MQSLVAAVQSSELVPVEEKEKIESRVRKGLLGPLSPEREAGPFMLYCCGDDLETIALKTNFPKDILYVTAIHYDWDNKAASLRSDSKDFNPINIQKDLAHSLLVATYMAAKEQLQDVLAGRKSPSQCPLLPKNMHSLEKLMNMITEMNKPPEGAGSHQYPGSGTVVHAQNVQINQQQNNHEKAQDIVEMTDEEIEAKRLEREEKYKALRGK